MIDRVGMLFLIPFLHYIRRVHSILIVICLSSVFDVFGHRLVTMAIWWWMHFWNDFFFLLLVSKTNIKRNQESKQIMVCLDLLFECSTELNGLCNAVWHIFDANDDWFGKWSKIMLIWISISFSKHFDFDIWCIGTFTLEPEMNLENFPQSPFYFSFNIILLLYYYYYHWCHEPWAMSTCTELVWWCTSVSRSTLAHTTLLLRDRNKKNKTKKSTMDS